MNVLILFIAWCVLFVLCWPLALLALVAAPLVWLIALPLRVIGTVFGGLLAFLRAIIYLPARLLS